MTAHDEFDEAVAAYALDALDPGAREAFEAHLATCQVCQLELAELRDVGVAMGLAVEPATPPASLRARTLARATAQMQDRPAAPRTSSRAMAPRSPISAYAWLGVAASLAFALATGAYAWWQQSEVGNLRRGLAEAAARAESLRSQLVAARLDAARLTTTVNVLRAPDVLRVDLRGSASAAGSTGKAYMSVANGLVFNFDHLPALAPNRTYQLWVVPRGAGAAPVSAGTFTVDANGMSAGSVPMPAGIQVAAAIAVSVEPTGGSPSPTTTPILVGTPG